MQYCDLLDKEDINYFGIGQLVTGGFYRRPQSLELAVRGMNEELWWKAIENYKEALKIKPDLSLAESYLGIAYFLDPEKKSIKLSQKFLDKSMLDIENDKTTNPFLKASILVNMSAIQIAAGNNNDALSKLDWAKKLCNKGKNVENNSHYFNSSGIVNSVLQLENSINYNTALIEYRRNNGTLDLKTLRELLRYLRSSYSSSVWWNIAYKMYQEGSVKSDRLSLSAEQILSEISIIVSPVKSITVNDFTIYLSQEMKEVTTKFKKIKKIPVVEEKNIFEYLIPEFGLSIIGGENVLGIKIKGNNPEINFGSDNPLYSNIRIGQTFNSLKRQFDGMRFTYITMPGTIQNRYFFITDLGLAFEVSNSIVNEIFIVQKPIN
jgi:tetratricopeptide (TPR) repeat protein